MRDFVIIFNIIYHKCIVTCSECFNSYCIHKFRSSFGKHHVIRDGEPVLVAYSGGPSSCAMVQLINGVSTLNLS